MESSRGSRNPRQGQSHVWGSYREELPGLFLRIATRGHRRFTIHRHMCFPCSCLFTLLRGWRESRHNSWPTLQHPAERGKQRNIPVKCQMFGRALRAADGFGGETGNSSGAGSLKVQEFAEWKGKWLQKIRDWWDGVQSDKSGFQFSMVPSWLSGLWQITSQPSLSFFRSCPF